MESKLCIYISAISSDHALTSATSLMYAIELRPVQPRAGIAGVRAAALCWSVVLKSTRALGTKVTAELTEFSEPFSQPAQRADCAERMDF